MADLLIRPARAEDAQVIDALGHAAALHQHRCDPTLFVVPDPHSCEWSDSALATSDDAVCLVATSSGVTIGFVHARTVAERHPIFVPHTYGLIELLAVLPDHRSRGVGTSLLVAAESWLAERGVCAIRLSVFASNHGAAKLYTRRGYVPLTLFMQRSTLQGDRKRAA